MVLAAGRGERLRPLTDRLPKVLAEVGGEPLLAHQLRWLANAGIRDVVINLHHLGEQIVAAVGDGRRYGVHVRYSLEPELLETGGGLVKALPLLGSDPFVLLNGDIYAEFDFATLPQHPARGNLAHLLVTPRPAFRERGDFKVEDARISARGDDYVYCGIAVVDPAALAGRRVEPFSLRDVFFELMDRGALGAQVWRGYWSDIGSLDQLQAVDARLRPRP
ncbi:MAG: nucleotidyltransferase family protein [Pseudomonadales bacterium]